MALLLVVVAAIGGVYVLFQIKSQVRTTVLRELQNRFPGLEIQIGPVQIEDQQGIAIHQLECHLPAQPGRPKRLLATINEIFLECPVTLKALIQRDIAIEKIILHSPVLRLHSDQTGIFPDWAHIHYQGDGMNSVPIEVRGGTILLNSVPNAQNAQNPQILPIRIADIACSITPPTLSARQTLSVFSHSGPSAGSNAEDTQAATSWRIAGTAKGDWFRQLHLEAYFNPQNQDWQMAAQCRQLDWTSDLLHFVPSQWKSSFSESETALD